MRKSAFSLIELLIVIAILGILATIVAYVSLQRPKQARDSQRKSDLAQIQRALEEAKVYCSGTHYPSYGTAGLSATAYLNYWNPGTGQPGRIKVYLEEFDYIRAAPLDPKNSPPQAYYYRTATTNSNACPDSSIDADTNLDPGSSTFRLWTNLEASDDPDIASSQTRCPWVYTGGFNANPYTTTTYVVCES